MKTKEDREQARAEQEAALVADQRSRVAFQKWQDERNSFRRAYFKELYEEADREAKRLWAIVGPDPLLAQISNDDEPEEEEDDD